MLTNQGRTALAADVPARYAGHSDLYYRQVVSNAAHQARTFSRVKTFQEAKIVRYRLINPMDRRTGQICQHMVGQEFSVAQGAEVMTDVLSQNTPEGIKAAAPWLSAKELDVVLDGKQRGSQEASSALSGANVTLPPFHPLCRTEPIAVS
jgi:hypothetical protein